MIKLENAIDRTIREHQEEYQRQRVSGRMDQTTLIDMDNYRNLQESVEAYREITSPSRHPFRAIARSIIEPVSFVFTPIILLSGLGYLGYKGITNRFKK
jgi:hypothetical protein